MKLFLNLEMSEMNSKEKTSYRNKQNKIIEAWQKLRTNLLTARIEELSPSTYSCCLCGCDEDNIIYCQDGGQLPFIVILVVREFIGMYYSICHTNGR